MTRRALARNTDPDTSHRAAREIKPALSRLQRAVLLYARSIGDVGFTDPMMQAHFNNHGSTYRTRRRELCDLGMIGDSRRYAKRSGHERKFIVWAITAAGWAADLGGSK